MGNLTQGGQELAQPSVLPAFQGDVNYMTDFANSMKGQTLAPGAFVSSPGMTTAANFGNNYFAPGGTGTMGTSQLGKILSGSNLDPASNPYLEKTIGSMQDAFQSTLGKGTDQLNAQFAGSGQYGGNSGARNNALTQFVRSSMGDFSNSLNNFLGGNYQQGQNQITQALGLMDQPLSGAGMSSALAQAPGQTAYAGQQAQNALSEIPFNLIEKIMQSAPVAGPSFAPSSPSEFGSWMNLANSYLTTGKGRGTGAGGGGSGGGGYGGAAGGSGVFEGGAGGGTSGADLGLIG